jgi:NAD(P)-dependent dehydrogenase (short-subunit alcohol dehydrogenase family)
MHPYELGGRPGRRGDAVVVTGAATGLGLEIALELAAQGMKVYATVPDMAMQGEVDAAASARGVQLHVLKLDLLDSASIGEAVDTIAAESGGIFALINNGGIGLRGAIEDSAEDEIRRLYDTNLTGTVLASRAVLPYMRAAGCGRIVTITSVGGRIPGFGVSVYCSSKFGQEGFAEGLALEVSPFGIQSIIVEPGMIKTTRWNELRGTAAGANDPSSPYHGYFWASEEVADKVVERSPTTPAQVARTVHQALTDEKPRMRYIVGRGAKIVIRLRRILPDRLFERLYYGSGMRRLVSRAGKPEPVAAPPPPLERAR